MLLFNPNSGVSGDMFVGALIELGVSFILLEKALAALKIPAVSIKYERTLRAGMLGTKFSVLKDGLPAEKNPDTEHRHLSDIIKLITNAHLEEKIITDAVAIFHILGEAEARVHDVCIDELHFHEVGAIDSIVDIVSGVVAMHALGNDRAISTPINVGNGTVSAAHGVMNVPAPATEQLLKQHCAKYYLDDGVPVGELATPTGVALLTYYCKKFIDSADGINIISSGFGAGAKQTPKANLFQVSMITPIGL